MNTRAVIAGVGARTPLGLSASQTGFLYRMGAAGMREAPLADEAGEPVTMCFVPTLDPYSVGLARAARLGIPAMEEALSGLGGAGRELRVRLALCFDEELGVKRPDGSTGAKALEAAFLERADAITGEVSVTAATRGPASAGFLLGEVIDALEAGAIDAGVLGGVHTDYEPARIAALAATGRLLRPGRLDAMIPGECAAFALLMRPDMARRLRMAGQARVHAAHTAVSRARPDNDEPAFEASALTACLKKAGAELREAGQKAGWILTDVTFETHRSSELHTALLRSQAVLCAPQHLDAPAHRMGYLGAAAMPLHMVLASEGFRRGWAPHPVALCLAGSDAGERAAMVISKPS